jgi:hypothetical protein
MAQPLPEGFDALLVALSGHEAQNAHCLPERLARRRESLCLSL